MYKLSKNGISFTRNIQHQQQDFLPIVQNTKRQRREQFQTLKKIPTDPNEKKWKRQTDFLSNEDWFRVTSIAGKQRTGKTYYSSIVLEELHKAFIKLGVRFGGEDNRFHICCYDIERQIEEGNFWILKDYIDGGKYEGRIKFHKALTPELLVDINSQVDENPKKPTIVIGDDVGSSEATKHSSSAKGGVLSDWVRTSHWRNICLILVVHTWLDLPRPFRVLTDKAVLFHWGSAAELDQIGKELRICSIPEWKKFLSLAFHEKKKDKHPHIIIERTKKDNPKPVYYYEDDDETVLFDMDVTIK